MIYSKNILVIGAHGKIGQHLVNKLSETNDFEAAAFLRDPEQVKDFRGEKVEAVIGNLEDSVEDLASQFEKYDTIVFTAGSGGNTGLEKTVAVDLDGAGRAIDAAKKSDIQKFIMVSAAGADNREVWDKSGIKNYYIAKYYADEYLRNSGLNHAILRPTGLTDDPGTGQIKASEDFRDLNPKISREDVAETIIHLLKMGETELGTIEISSGSDSIEKALAETILAEEVPA